MRFTIFGILAVTTVVAVLLAIAKYLPQLLLVLSLLILSYAITGPIFILVATIVGAEAKGQMLDPRTSPVAVVMTKLWLWSMAFFALLVILAFVVASLS